MSVVLHRLAVLPTAALGGPPLIFAVALGVGIHRHRTRRTGP
jgi:hypothetical protein